MNAEANVACPHKFTSQAGENHLILLLDRSTKAVSDKLFSAAIFCINTSSSKSEKITADGLVEASQENVPPELENQSEELIAYGKRIRDQHDLWHVLTGYGRDTLGEVCLLWFTYA